MIAFLVTDHATGVASVIATGVASRRYRVWGREGYHWWNVLGRQCVVWVTKSINERLLLQSFEIWFIRITMPRVNKYVELLSDRCRARGDWHWLYSPGSWWKEHAGLTVVEPDTGSFYGFWPVWA